MFTVSSCGIVAAYRWLSALVYGVWMVVCTVLDPRSVVYSSDRHRSCCGGSRLLFTCPTAHMHNVRNVVTVVCQALSSVTHNDTLFAGGCKNMSGYYASHNGDARSPLAIVPSHQPQQQVPDLIAKQHGHHHNHSGKQHNSRYRADVT